MGMMKRSRKFGRASGWKLYRAVFLSFLLVAISALPVRSAASVRIGAFLAVTGQGAFLGAPALATLKLYVDLFNLQGGLLGRKVELVQYDVGVDTRRAQTAVRRLINVDRVDVLIGGSTTGATMAVLPMVEKSGIPFIALDGASSITNPAHKWVFKAAQTDRLACAKILQDMQKRAIKKIAILSGNGGYGRSMRGHCMGLAKPFGIEVVADEVYKSRTRRVVDQLKRIRANSAVEAVLNIGYGSTPAYITSQYRHLKFAQPLYLTPAAANRDYLDLASDDADGVRMPVAPLVVADKLSDRDPIKKIVTDYQNIYAKRWDVPPSVYGSYAHDAILIAAAAIRRAGTTNKEAVRRAIETTHNLIGANGVYRLNTDDHLGLDLGAFHMTVIKSGQWELID